MKTFSAKPGEIERKWVLIDLKDKVLGRAATQIVNILRGKTKPTYTPHVDTGDFVVVINAAQVKLTGNKLKEKMYYQHSGYIGGMKVIPAESLLNKHPEDLITLAVKRMLPPNRLSRQLLKKLKVYAGELHPHESQNPQALEI